MTEHCAGCGGDLEAWEEPSRDQHGRCWHTRCSLEYAELADVQLFRFRLLCAVRRNHVGTGQLNRIAGDR